MDLKVSRKAKIPGFIFLSPKNPDIGTKIDIIIWIHRYDCMQIIQSLPSRNVFFLSKNKVMIFLFQSQAISDINLYLHIVSVNMNVKLVQKIKERPPKVYAWAEKLVWREILPRLNLASNTQFSERILKLNKDIFFVELQLSNLF